MSRLLWGALVALALSMPARAADTLVHLASFHCAHCAAYESYSPGIELAARARGVQVIFAPISLSEATTYSAELAYFAVRDQDTGAAQVVRQNLFLGGQEGLPFEDIAQVAEWLRLHAPTLSEEWDQLPVLVAKDEPRAALYRAYNLVRTAGVQAVPAFVWVHDGQVMGSVQREDNESASELAKRVTALLNAIKEQH